MGYKDCEAGHALIEEADFDRLETLPEKVGFVVYRYEGGVRPVWFIAIGGPGEDDLPFGFFTPRGSPHFVKRATELSGPFAEVFNTLYADLCDRAPGHPWFGPFEDTGVSLSLQIANALGTKVLSLASDSGYEAEFACLLEPDRIERIRCRYAEMHLLFEAGKVRVAPLIAGHPCLNQVAGIEAVQTVRKPSRFKGWDKEVVRQELDAFVGFPLSAIAEEFPDETIPPPREMTPVAKRTRSGKVKRLD